MRIRIIDNTGMKGILEIGEVYEAKLTRSNKTLISVNGQDYDLNTSLTLNGYDVL